MDNNTAVIIVKLIDTNYRNCDVIYLIRLGIMLLHLSQIYDPPNEAILVIDMKGVFENYKLVRLGYYFAFRLVSCISRA